VLETDERKGQCDACGKKPRIVAQLDSGQWICRKCFEGMHGGPRMTIRQRNYLHALCLDVSCVATMDQASELIGQHEALSAICATVFDQMYHVSPRQFAIGREECRRFVAAIITREPDFFWRVLEAQHNEDRDCQPPGVYPTEPVLRKLAQRIEGQFGARVPWRPGQWPDNTPEGFSMTIESREIEWS